MNRRPNSFIGRVIVLERLRRPKGGRFFMIWGKDDADLASKLSKAEAEGGHLPAERRARSTWRFVEKQLAEAARGALDTKEVWAALRVVLALEGIKCEPK